MRADHVELWRAIESFQIGPPDCDLPFGARLARENGWSLPFAARVIAEYKRFVFLAATAPHAGASQRDTSSGTGTPRRSTATNRSSPLHRRVTSGPGCARGSQAPTG